MPSVTTEIIASRSVPAVSGVIAWVNASSSYSSTLLPWSSRISLMTWGSMITPSLATAAGHQRHLQRGRLHVVLADRGLGDERRVVDDRLGEVRLHTAREVEGHVAVEPETWAVSSSASPPMSTPIWANDVLHEFCRISNSVPPQLEPPKFGDRPAAARRLVAVSVTGTRAARGDPVALDAAGGR